MSDPNSAPEAPTFSPDGHEMLVVSWSAVPGKHPTLGRGSWNVVITDRRLAIAKASWKQKMARGAAIGAGMSAGLAGVAHAVTASAIAGVGAALSQSPIPKIDEGRIHESAAMDVSLEGLGEHLLQVPLDQVRSMHFRKGGLFSDSKVVLSLDAGDFTGEIGGVKDAHRVFSELLPGRVTIG